MASKIQSHHVYVAITPYKVDGSSAEEFNELDVMTAYDQYHKYFYVCLHAGWKSDYGGHGCIIMGADDPLTGPKYVKIKDSPKNSQKTINEIGAAMELARDAIAWLFDKRDWQRLYVAVMNIALNGYTEKYRQQMEQLMNNTNNQNSEDKDMRLNMNANNNETKNVAMEPQVNNNPIEDAQAVEVTTEADVPEVDDIKPQVVRATAKSDGGSKTADVPQTSDIKPQTSNQPAVTIPMGQHGSIVIAGVGGKKSDGGSKTEDVHQPSDIKPQTSTKVQDSVPQVRLVVYTTRHGDQAPRIDGFGGEDDPRWKRHYDEKLRLKKAAKEADKKNEKLKARMKGKSKEERAELLKQWVSVGSDPFNATVHTDFATDNKSYFFLMGAKYMAVAQQLVDAYNSGDAAAIAAAEQAVMDVKNGIVAERKAAREERKAANSQPSAVSSQTSGEKSYTLDEVAAMLGKLLPQGAASTEDIKKLLKAA